MKRFLALTLHFIAVSLLMAFSLAPHHHHGEALCFLMERCHIDGAVNDEHTHHDASDSHLPGDAHFGEINDVIAPQNNSERIEADCRQHTVLLCLPPSLNVLTAYKSGNTHRFLFCCIYKSPFQDSPHSLRAPPAQTAN